MTPEKLKAARQLYDGRQHTIAEIAATLGVSRATKLTLADVTPAMAALRPLAAESLAGAEREVDGLWRAEAVAA
jgi:hypothetical protein